MVDSIPVKSREHFQTLAGEDEKIELERTQAGVLYDVWEAAPGKRLLLVVPGWLAQSDFGARRPFMIGDIQHDNPESGAVLYSNMRLVNVSVVENECFDKCSLDESLESFDLSKGEDSYVDEAEMSWLARSQHTAYVMD